MRTEIDELNHPSYVFRVFSETERRSKLHASCVVETHVEDEQKCTIHILNIVDGITMRALRPKIKAKVMALGFTDYEFCRSYDEQYIKRRI